MRDANPDAFEGLRAMNNRKRLQVKRQGQSYKESRKRHRAGQTYKQTIWYEGCNIQVALTLSPSPGLSASQRRAGDSDVHATVELSNTISTERILKRGYRRTTVALKNQQAYCDRERALGKDTLYDLDFRQGNSLWYNFE